MTDFFGIKITLNPWLLLAVIVLTTAACAYLVNLLLLKLLKRAVEKSAGRASDHIYPLLERFLFPSLIIAGLLLLEDAAPLPGKVLRAAHGLLVALAILMAVLLAAKATLLFLRSVSARYESMHNIKEPAEAATKIIFVALGGMIILDNLGVSITPLITTLGIGSLAIAIALQETLSNLFAGLYIKADRPVQIGHYIRLASGEEGYVERIGWRNTAIRPLPNAIIVIPNSKLVQSNITNYYGGASESAVLVQVGVHCNNDLEKVEKITREVAREVMGCVSESMPSCEPFIRYQSLNPSRIDFAVILRGRDAVGGFLLKHEFIKKLHSRYQEENITMA